KSTSCKSIASTMQPTHELYESFREKYIRLNDEYDKKQYLVPYLMSSHPGCDLDAAIELACYLKKIGHTPQQVQDFHPTPATLSTTMYYTGMHPITREKVYVAKSFEEKLAQRALMQFNYPKNYDIVYRALMKAGREDLIGYGKNCLIPPHKNAKKPAYYGKPSSQSAARKTVNHQKKTESPSKGRSSHPARRNSK
ncbi:MAG: DUF3362 domain-containing protein, partial [Erysipelotrichaceae bacterium]|nr:DUF3362 domain-containing protein [Erysipelotrichaceae bacterium]